MNTDSHSYDPVDLTERGSDSFPDTALQIADLAPRPVVPVGATIQGRGFDLLSCGWGR